MIRKSILLHTKIVSSSITTENFAKLLFTWLRVTGVVDHHMSKERSNWYFTPCGRHSIASSCCDLVKIIRLCKRIFHFSVNSANIYLHKTTQWWWLQISQHKSFGIYVGSHCQSCWIDFFLQTPNIDGNWNEIFAGWNNLQTPSNVSKSIFFLFFVHPSGQFNLPHRLIWPNIRNSM